MILGKDFVILNMPKTGTTSRHHLAKEYSCCVVMPSWARNLKIARKCFGVICRWKRTKNRKKPSTFLQWVLGASLYKILYYSEGAPEKLRIICLRPSTVSYAAYELPAEDARKEIVSVLRNPYRHLVSRYQKGIDVKSECRILGIRDGHNFTFVEFLQSVSPQWARLRAKLHLGVESINYPLGILSFDFIRMYLKDSVKIFTMSAEEFNEYCISDDYKKDMYPIKFFRTETMNRQLCEYLKSKPYLNSQIIYEIFKVAEPKNVSKKKADAVWDEETAAYFEKTEKFYIRMVKELAPLPEDDF